MKLLEDRIMAEGRFLPPEIIKVDSFLNHQIDPVLMEEMGKEFFRLFRDAGVSKILTVEASGIAMALETARCFRVPMVFAKKSRTRNISSDVWTAPVFSFTHQTMNTIMVSRQYLNRGDRVLVIDDFLANGEALKGLIHLCEQAGADVAGCGVAIEKYFQPGGRELREKGYHVEALASIESMNAETGEVVFHR